MGYVCVRVCAFIHGVDVCVTFMWYVCICMCVKSMGAGSNAEVPLINPHKGTITRLLWFCLAKTKWSLPSSIRTYHHASPFHTTHTRTQ